MFAVIRSGAKQYKVAPNDVIRVEKLAGEPGDVVTLDDVLMVGGGEGAAIGAPQVAKAQVTATVLAQSRSDKIIVFKKERRKNFRRKKGHRQDLTVLRVTDIVVDGKTAAAEAKKAAPSQEQTAEPAATEAQAGDRGETVRTEEETV